MDVTEYLEHKIPDYAQLNDAERRAISQFSLLWAAFEGMVCNTAANPTLLLQVPLTLQNNETLESVDSYDAINYFRNRYFQNGDFTHFFNGLHLERGSRKDQELVMSVISGASNGPVEVLQTLLLVCYRLRNNLFHGVKLQYGIAGQLENFQHACGILMAVMDRHPEAY